MKHGFFSQAQVDVQEGITDEDYDLFYEIWQEFDPKGSQYIKYDHLAEFLDVLEPPLQLPKPNKYKIIALNVPIVNHTNPNSGEVQEECIFCADILDILTQDFFASKSQAPIIEEEDNPAIEGVKVRFIEFCTLSKSYN